MAGHESPRWRPQGDTETPLDPEAAPTLTSNPTKQGYVRFTNTAPVDTSQPVPDDGEGNYCER